MKWLNKVKKFFSAKEKVASPITPIVVGPKTEQKETRPHREPKYRKANYLPAEGMTWNPLVSFPRNAKCFCESGKKAKKCCLPLMRRVAPTEAAAFINKFWDEIVSGKLSLKDAKPNYEEPV